MDEFNLSKFKKYKELLLKWQKTINLISPASINNIEQRHFIDSSQIAPLIKKDDKVVDLGSGAGFPAMVLSILGINNLTLIESDERKCLFLKEVARVYNLNVFIENMRIEEFSQKYPKQKFSVVTARALAELSSLLDYAYPLLLENGRCIFLKGEKADDEIKFALKKYSFHVEHIQSKTDLKAKILVLSNIKKLSK